MTSEIATTQGSWESLNECPLRLRTGLRFRSEGPGNDWICFLEDSISGRSYALSRWQRWLLELIESRTPTQDAARLVIASFPDLATRDSIVRFVGWLTGEKLLEKISTVNVDPGEPSEVTGPAPLRNSRLLRLPRHVRHFSMNTVAVLLIAAGGWMLKPALRDVPSANPDLAEPTVSEAQADEESGRVFAVRAASAGILAEVFVRDGDEVNAGDLIARIEDPVELYLLDDLKRQLGESRIRRDRYYLASDREEYLAEMQRIAGLSRQIGNSQAQANLAELRAPVGGLVETEVLCGQVGSEVALGDILLKVHAPDPANREMLAGNP